MKEKLHFQVRAHTGRVFLSVRFNSKRDACWQQFQCDPCWELWNDQVLPGTSQKKFLLLAKILLGAVHKHPTKCCRGNDGLTLLLSCID